MNISCNIRQNFQHSEAFKGLKSVYLRLDISNSELLQTTLLYLNHVVHVEGAIIDHAHAKVEQKQDWHFFCKEIVPFLQDCKKY